MSKEMKRPTSHISGNSIKPALSKAVEFYTDNNRQAYECIRERDEYIDYLESQLSNAKPQQALPVVPECVAEWYESHKDLEYAIYVFCGKFYRDTSRSNEELSDFEIWFDNSDNKAIETLILMKNGYQVEKPKLFYLKNKLTGLNLVLEKCFNPSGDHVGERFREYNMQYIATDEQEARLYKNTFTQEETDDLDTGGYEQIEVVK